MPSRKLIDFSPVVVLMTSAISTILSSELSLSHEAFAFGIVSLLSSLTSIGFGVGLIYVLGDVRGVILNVRRASLTSATTSLIVMIKDIGVRFPNLFVYCLSIPQVSLFFNLHFRGLVSLCLLICLYKRSGQGRALVRSFWRHSLSPFNPMTKGGASRCVL